jgi:hypothetical protein
MNSIERRTAMKRYSMLVVLMVMMAISTSLFAGEGSRRDVRDLSYLNFNPVVMSSTQLASTVNALNDRKDARDLSYLNSTGNSEVSSQEIVVQGFNDRRDARDLAYLPGNAKEAGVDQPGNINLMCCQR